MTIHRFLTQACVGVAVLVLSIALSPGISLSPLNAAPQQKGGATKEPVDTKKPASAATGPKNQAAGDRARSGVSDEVLTAGDGWPIHVTYFESAAGKESPVVVLLPSAEGTESRDTRTRRVWEKTAIALQKNGFAVVTVDLRKHGDSKPALEADSENAKKAAATDYPNMAGFDLEAVKEFLLRKHQEEKLNVRKLAVISAGSSCMVALAFSIADWDKKPYPDAPLLADRTPRGQDVRALVMLSPKTSVKNLGSGVMLKMVRGLPVAMMILASTAIKADAQNAEKVYKAVDLKTEESKEFRKLILSSVNASAERFVEGNVADTTTQLIIEFLGKNVRDADFPWKSRKSRL